MFFDGIHLTLVDEIETETSWHSGVDRSLNFRKKMATLTAKET